MDADAVLEAVCEQVQELHTSQARAQEREHASRIFELGQKKLATADKPWLAREFFEVCEQLEELQRAPPLPSDLPAPARVKCCRSCSIAFESSG